MATTISSGTNPYKLGSPPDFGVLYSGRALEFDGVADYVTGSLPTSHSGLSTWSISWWSKADSFSTDYSRVMTLDGGGTRVGFRSTGKISFLFNATDSDINSTGTAQSTGTWHYNVITFDKATTTVKHYLDGALDFTKADCTDTTLDSGGTFYIGTYTGSSLFFDGEITNIQIWDKVWSLSDVQYAYTHPEKLITDNSAVTSGITISNLKAWYPCTEGNPRSPQTTVYDGSPKELGSEMAGSLDWNNSSGDPYETFTSSGNSVTEADNTSGWGIASTDAFTIASGNIYKVTFNFTLNSGAVPNKVLVASGADVDAAEQLVVTSVSNGLQSHYFTAVNSGSTYRFGVRENSATNWSLSDLSIREVQMGNHGTTTFLGDELWDSPASVFTSGTYAWVVYGTNTIANDSNALKITYNNDARGAYVWFKDASDLSSDLTVGRTYRVTFDAKVGSGDSVDVTAHATGTPSVTVTETTFTSKSIDFVCSQATSNYLDTLNMASGEEIWLDNISLKEVGVAAGWTTADAEPLIPQTALMGMSKPMVFNGIDEYVTCGSISEIAPTSNVAVSLWFQAPNISNYDCFVSRKVDANNLYKIWYFSNKLILEVYEGSSKYGRYIDWTPDSDLHHLVAIWDTSGTADANATLYLDGNSPSHTAIGGLGNGGCSTNFQIGLGDTDYFSGIINEVATFNTVLSLAQVQELFNDGISFDLDGSTLTGSPTLVNYWRNTGLGTWTDLEGSDNGTPTNASDTILLPEGTTSGKDILGFPLTHTNNGWLNIDGSEYVDCGNSSVINFSEFNFTYEAWVKMDDSTPASNVCVIGGGANSYLFVIQTDGYLRFEEKGTGTQTVSTGRITDTNWHHIAVSAHDTDKITFFLDGDEKDTDTYAQLADTNNTYTVGQHGADGDYFKGSIDEVKFYGRALVEAEIFKNYKHGLSKHL